ncbi:hypothetical protein GCM10007858_22540 [Bradyrhizobium liaoningense]|nr:hypothetical protein GCM10007858_22540 [Bradyrhizobium liaoningense]
MGIERGNPNTATRHSDNKMLCLQVPKGLAHGDVAGIEFSCNVILTEWCAWR